eukprot:5210810-Pleurochrysis_carterae.AAC.6
MAAATVTQRSQPQPVTRDFCKHAGSAQIPKGATPTHASTCLASRRRSTRSPLPLRIPRDARKAESSRLTERLSYTSPEAAP